MPSLLTCRETLFACLPRRRWPTRADDLGEESGESRTLVPAATAGRLPSIVGAAVVGVGVGSTGPRGMSGAVRLSTLQHPAGPATQTRRDNPAAQRNTNPSRAVQAQGVRTTTEPGQPSSGFVTPVSAACPTGWLSLAAGTVSTGLPRCQGQAASRWPPASLDSSYAPRDRQLREEQGENGQDLCCSGPMTRC